MALNRLSVTRWPMTLPAFTLRPKITPLASKMEATAPSGTDLEVSTSSKQSGRRPMLST